MGFDCTLAEEGGQGPGVVDGGHGGGRKEERMNGDGDGTIACCPYKIAASVVKRCRDVAS